MALWKELTCETWEEMGDVELGKEMATVAIPCPQLVDFSISSPFSLSHHHLLRSMK